MYMPSYVRIGIAWAVCAAAGIISSMFIATDASSWYASLTVPSFTPPSEWFRPILVLQYVLMAIAASSVWLHDKHADDFTGWVPLFFAHLTSAMAWTILFFGFHAIFLSLVNAIILAIAVFFLLCGAWQITRLAFWSFLPYFLWVLYALVLNLGIFLMN